jgi:Putative peptidoglycan binding domain.
MKGQAAAPKTSTNPEAPAAGAAGAGAASSVPAAGQQNAQANAGAKAKKPDPQQVQQIKSQHANFRAQPKPQQVPAVTFNQNYRIQGSDRWQGQHYQVFRSYHPEWHDQGWYHSHYNRVELIGGGYYFFNNGYWFPAWGYSPSAQYYAYDGPIYAGQHAEPPDKVIADVQAVLQQMGYYKGDVDGLLGPLTREALTAYQADQGLTQTAAIDEPTLQSLEIS